MAKNGDWIISLQLPAQWMPVKLIQCDLAHHSEWFKKCEDAELGIDASDAREKLGLQIRSDLSPLGFGQVFWRGDGGMFASDSATPDEVVEAARVLLKTFLHWRESQDYSSLLLSDLRMRISCTECHVYAGPHPEYWSSEEFNSFCKFERKFGHEDTISITAEIRKGVRQYATLFDPESAISIGVPGRQYKLYFDSTTAPVRTKQEAVEWFHKQFGAGRAPGLICSQLFAMGESIVIAISPSPTDSITIELRETEQDGFGDLELDPNWNKETETVVQEIGNDKDLWKAAPVFFRPALKDFPAAQIDYLRIRYSKARGFHWWLKKSEVLRAKLLAKSIDFDAGAPRRPGILVTHNVLLGKERDGSRFVLLAQRSSRFGKSGYHGGMWSASMEEQFDIRDLDLEATVQRGLNEELLGAEAAYVEPKLIALFLEESLLNLSVASICYTNFTYDELFHLWLQSKQDKEEHYQIAALPLGNSSVVKRCISASEIAAEAQEICIVHPDLKSRWELAKQEGTMKLHPTSAFRLGLALWATKSEKETLHRATVAGC